MPDKGIQRTALRGPPLMPKALGRNSNNFLLMFVTTVLVS